MRTSLFRRVVVDWVVEQRSARFRRARLDEDGPEQQRDFGSEVSATESEPFR